MQVQAAHAFICILQPLFPCRKSEELLLATFKSQLTIFFHPLLRGTMLFLRCMHHVRFNVPDPIQCADSTGQYARTIERIFIVVLMATSLSLTGLPFSCSVGPAYLSFLSCCSFVSWYLATHMQLFHIVILLLL